MRREERLSFAVGQGISYRDILGRVRACILEKIQEEDLDAVICRRIYLSPRGGRVTCDLCLIPKKET